jgi:hypothetical protein
MNNLEEVTYKVNLRYKEVMGYGALCNFRNLQISSTNTSNPSYINLTFALCMIY